MPTVTLNMSLFSPLAPEFEFVAFRDQMLYDIYVYEQEPLPETDEFFNSWLTRENDEEFWVYRNGTELWDNLSLDCLTFAVATKDDLNAHEPTLEGYSHVKKLHLMGGLMALPKHFETLEEWHSLLKDGRVNDEH